VNEKIGAHEFAMAEDELFRERESQSEGYWSGIGQQGGKWAVYCGDALQTLKSLPKDCVHSVITSPPYFWLRDYGVDGQFGLEDTIQDYVENLSNVMDEVKRVLRPDGVAFFNIGDTFYSGKGRSHGKDNKSKKRRFGLRAVDKSGGMGIGLQKKSLIGIPWRVAMSLASRGWVLRSSVIWHRKNRLPEHVRDRPGRSYEYVFILAKNRKYYFNKQALIDKKIEEDLWTIAAKPKANGGLDTAPFPDELVLRCLEVGCPEKGIVLDPFLGGGTTLRVALETGRSGIGIELNKRFCEYVVGNLEN
jgi:DNA modification methylase